MRLIPYVGHRRRLPCAIGLGIHDFSKVAAAPWFGVPFRVPRVPLKASCSSSPLPSPRPLSISGDIIAISSVTGRTSSGPRHQEHHARRRHRHDAGELHRRASNTTYSE
ncbi:MAG: hypothetical protein ACLSTO_07590 [Bilophila wadsworthia]